MTAEEFTEALWRRYGHNPTNDEPIWPGTIYVAATVRDAMAQAFVEGLEAAAHVVEQMTQCHTRGCGTAEHVSLRRAARLIRGLIEDAAEPPKEASKELK